MSFEKYQRFLKNKHKFDPKPLTSDVVDDFKEHTQAFLSVIKSEDNNQLKSVLKPFVIDLIKYMNRNDFSFEDLLKDEYNL